MSSWLPAENKRRYQEKLNKRLKLGSASILYFDRLFWSVFAKSSAQIQSMFKPLRSNLRTLLKCQGKTLWIPPVEILPSLPSSQNLFMLQSWCHPAPTSTGWQNLVTFWQWIFSFSLKKKKKWVHRQGFHLLLSADACQGRVLCLLVGILSLSSIIRETCNVDQLLPWHHEDMKEPADFICTSHF